MALEAEGLGATLQHFHWVPDVTQYFRECTFYACAREICLANIDAENELGLPTSWKPKSQLVFGTPVAPAGEKTFKPIEEKLKIFS
jgi:uncharacterized protein